MIFSRYVLLLPLAVLASITGELHAGSNKISLRLLAFARVGEAREVMISGPDGKRLHRQPVGLPTEQLLPPVEVVGRSLFFHASAATPLPLGMIELPAGGNDFLIIFLPSAMDAALPYRPIAVPLPRESFGSGDQAFVNCCGSTVGFTIGGEKLLVPEGNSAIYHPKQVAGSRSMVGYRQQADGKWEASPFYSSRMIVQDGVRNLILIFRDPRTGFPDFRGVVDFVPRP